MRTIIIYDTATGNTRAIANKMKEVLEKYNHECDIYRDKDIQNEIKSNPHYFDSYTLVCLGSCTHGFQPAITFKKFINIIKDYDLKGDFDITIDLVYKKGRKPNSIRLENNPAVKEELQKLIE